MSDSSQSEAPGGPKTEGNPLVQKINLLIGLGQKLQEDELTSEKVQDLGSMVSELAWSLKDEIGGTHQAIPSDYDLIRFDEQLFLALEEFEGEKTQFPLSFSNEWVGSFFYPPQKVKACFQALLHTLRDHFDFPHSELTVVVRIQGWKDSGVKAVIEIGLPQAMHANSQQLTRWILSLNAVFDAAQRGQAEFALSRINEAQAIGQFFFPFSPPNPQ